MAICTADVMEKRFVLTWRMATYKFNCEVMSRYMCVLYKCVVSIHTLYIEDYGLLFFQTPEKAERASDVMQLYKIKFTLMT